MSLIDNFLILQKDALSHFNQFRGLFKEINGKNWKFSIEKERERKTQMVKVAKSCHQVTWTQKNMTKKSELE